LDDVKSKTASLEIKKPSQTLAGIAQAFQT